MWRHAEGDNLLLLADRLEFKRVVALVAVDNQQPMRPHRTRLRMLVEVF